MDINCAIFICKISNDKIVCYVNLIFYINFVFHTGKTTIIIGGKTSNTVYVSSVEYFGPLNITIPPLSTLQVIKTAAYVNGTLYVCGTQNGDMDVCCKYDLAAASGSWDLLTTIPSTNNDHNKSNAAAFKNFFWYFTNKMIQVPVDGSSVTSYDLNLGINPCVASNGSNTIIITGLDSSLMINSNTSSPEIWRTDVKLTENLHSCGCLWLGNTIYVTGGEDETASTKVTHLIKSDTFEVTLGDPLPVAITDHGMGVIDGRPAVIGGIINGVYSSAIYVHDSSSHTWLLSNQSLPAARASFVSVTF